MFHLTCLDDSKPCPRCERRTKHELSKLEEDDTDDEVENVEPVVAEVL